MFPHFLIILYYKNFFTARNANSVQFPYIPKHSCRLHVKVCCRHTKRRSFFLKDVAFTPSFLSLARRLAKLYLHFQFRVWSGSTPIRQRAAASTPPGGWFWENLILIFQCWFSRRISLPPQNYGGNGRKRRMRRWLFLIAKSKRGFPVAALAISVQNILKSHVSRWILAITLLLHTRLVLS